MSIQDYVTLVCVHATKRRTHSMTASGNKATLLYVRDFVGSGDEILMRLLDRHGIARQSGLAKSLLAKVDLELAICIAPSRISS